MPLVLCVFPRGKLWDLYSRLPSLAFDITWLAAREEQLIDEHLVSLGRRSALERAAYLLLHLFVRADEAGLVKNGSIQFPFTQQHLADTLGMSLVHTNKTLKRLLLTKTVHWKDRLFEIIDRTATRQHRPQRCYPSSTPALYLKSSEWCWACTPAANQGRLIGASCRYSFLLLPHVSNDRLRLLPRLNSICKKSQ